MLLTLEELVKQVGVEMPLDDLSRKLAYYASGLKSTLIGAHHVTCSDEAEREAVEAFQTQFVRHLLPSFKYWAKAPFRTANLGGRYEWGGIPIAEDHFATTESDSGFKVLLVKINSHISVEQGSKGPVYGHMKRYGSESVYCGALHSLMEGSSLPAIDDLRDAWLCEDPDRLKKLMTSKSFEKRQRGLVAALINARLQARRAIVEIQNHVPVTPTLYVVVPCVTLNRPERDTEILCGVYVADYRTTGGTAQYHGLGDDPSTFLVDEALGQIRVADGTESVTREARDHRQLIAEDLETDSVAREEDQKLRSLLQAVFKKEHHEPSRARAILESLVGMLAALSPIPLALMLFASGAVSIHHIYRAHRLTRTGAREKSARPIIDEFLKAVDHMPPEKTRDLVEALASRVGGTEPQVTAPPPSSEVGSG